MIELIATIDEKFSRGLRNVGMPSSLKTFLRWYTRFGDGFYWIFIIWLLLYYSTIGATIVTYGLMAVGFSLIVYWSLKLGLKRRRPYNKHEGIEKEIAPLDRYSFPSGHTLNNLAPALVVAHYLNPWLFAVVILVPLSWGILRIYFGVHYLFDVLAGFVFGILCGILALYIGPLIPFPWI